MPQGLLFFPCLAVMLLTAFALVLMFRGRKAALRSGAIAAAYFKTYDNGQTLPRKARQAERCYHNLLESTPPFYFLCAAAMALGLVDAALLALAWAYVAVRAAQSAVHLTVNRIGPRATLFGVSWLLLLAIAARLALALA